MRRPTTIKRQQPEQPRRTCGECGQGTFDMKFENLSLDGKPTLVACPFQPYKMVVSERSCAHFIE